MIFQMRKVSVAVALAVGAVLSPMSANAAIQFNNLLGSGSGLINGIATGTSPSPQANVDNAGITQTKSGIGCGTTPDLTDPTCTATLAASTIYVEAQLGLMGSFQAAAGKAYTLLMAVPVYTWVPAIGILKTLYNTNAAPGTFEIWANDTGTQPNVGAGTGFNGEGSLAYGGAHLDGVQEFSDAVGPA